MGRLAGKVALITGAGTGIGRAAALRFASEGARVVLSEINESSGAAVAAEINAQGGEALFVRTDVTDEPSVEASIGAATGRFGKLDILYNNAGGATMADGPLVDAPLEEFWRAIRLDLYGTWLNCRFGIPALRANGGGVIINTTSVIAMSGTSGADCYTAAKGAIAALTRSMAHEYAPDNIRVNALAPGGTLTDRVKARMDPNNPKAPLRDVRKPLFDFAEPEDIANAALYLASDESRKVCGTILTVDSGWTA